MARDRVGRQARLPRLGRAPGELILMAIDEIGWLHLVALNNLA